MLYNHTLNDIRTNVNTGVEYEIALFYQLLKVKPQEQIQVKEAINFRHDNREVERIIAYTDTTAILRALRTRGLSIVDVSFETQNDLVGPADVVLHTETTKGERVQIGLSIKYSNSCTLNVTGRKFITDAQIAALKAKYTNEYVPKFKEYMKKTYGHAKNWHRKRCPINDLMIDDIRTAVLENWPNIEDKTALMKNLYHDESPIEFWVVNYRANDYKLNTVPASIDMKRANEVQVRKHESSYVAFYLDDKRIGHMQVKFNNGFVEYNFNNAGKRKRATCDFIEDGIEFIYGQPFGSWNFSVED